MNVIFLDIDGVLNCSDSKIEAGFVWGIDPILVDRLNRICEQIEDLTVVLCSSWKYAVRSGHIDINQLLQEQGYNGPVITELTPNIDYVYLSRGMEIDAWQKANKVDNFVILDDDAECQDFKYLQDRVIKPSFDEGGLLEEHIDRAIEMMKEK